MTSIPVDPDAPQAHDWLVQELAKPEYQAAKPTWFDLASKAVQDWLSSLFSAGSGTFSGVLLIVILVLAVALLVIAFVVFGLPRINRRSGLRTDALFGAQDTRDAATLRDSAERAARAGDWTLAVEERFRAIAQSLDERTIVMLTPGTTANDFAARAATAVAAERQRLMNAARTFDGVRYLGRSASPDQYGELVALDTALQAARPGALAEPSERVNAG
ncbi:MAG TPA: DUF4129 domain-containing protein [Diaminobutyricibacter sp.]|uniref:DUF4129 domain-containing protein n=1 Tax=Leifsonia sp. McL0618 TaxID=3415677 RepID=UPI0033725C59